MSQITATNEGIVIKVASDLEKKVDRILELLENKELSNFDNGRKFNGKNAKIIDSYTGKNIKKKISQLNNNCLDCHTQFREPKK